MVTLESALLAAGTKVVVEELAGWLKDRGKELSEKDWSEMGILVGRKLTVDYENIESSRLHKSRKTTVVQRIESAAEIYRELEIIGRNRGFDQQAIEVYSNLADICSNWSIETDGLGVEAYRDRGEEFFGVYEEYQELVG